TDRFGNKHYTIEGINYLAQQVMNSFSYITLNDVDFDTGATISKPNEVLFNPGDNSYYKWTGSFAAGPKVVPANSTPETSGGVGPGKWLNVGDAALRSDLANGGKASLVGYEDETVESALDDLYTGRDKDGFNKVGRFLNLAELRAFPPKAIGDVVYAVSAASTSYSDIHYGGGNFQAVDKGALVDDGGVTIVPTTGALAWKRMFDGMVSALYFGLKPDGISDNNEALNIAANYGRDKKCTIQLPPGNILSAGALPVYKASGFIGSGRKQTVFIKTTHDGFPVASGVSPDALCVVLGDSYDPNDDTGASDCSWAKLQGLTLTKSGVTARSDCPMYGIWAPRVNTSRFIDISVEYGYYGYWSVSSWSNTFENMQILGMSEIQFAGFHVSREASGTFILSGTSNILNNVGIANYQIGFKIDAMQYTTMNSCSADSIKPMIGTSETNASAYSFINPHGITMNSCGSEDVSGERLSIVMKNIAAFDATMVVNAYQGQIIPSNPKASGTPIYRIQSENTAMNLSVSFLNCNLKKDVSLANQVAGFVSGANTYLFDIGSVIDVPTTGGGAKYTKM
ncbi:tail fiber/spike domain-containing protein, partial [Dryocola clanedunensis]